MLHIEVASVTMYWRQINSRQSQEKWHNRATQAAETKREAVWCEDPFCAGSGRLIVSCGVTDSGDQPMNTGWVVDLGSMEYRAAWDLQRRVAQGVAKNLVPDVLLLVEHPPVYTLGRAAHGSAQNLIWDQDKRTREGIGFVEVDRGGDITYHGPGQIVGYPILDLNRYGRDLHQYLRNLEEALIRTLEEFGVIGERMPPNTGVWVGNEKVAAIGVKASRWITQHGFALNVAPNLEHFQGIVPCGIQDKGVTSLEKLTGRRMTLDEVKPVVVRHLARVLALDFETITLSSLMDRIS